MIISREITIPSLSGDEPRRAWVYLPEDWDEEERRYPVLYMFEGQNVFFDEEATCGKSWGMADFAEYTDLPVIVAAVESHRGANGERLSEYSPFTVREPGLGGYVVGRGRATMEWLVHTFKPMIDAEVPTLPDREHTMIAGSSMDEVVYRNSPVHYLSNMPTDHPYIEKYNRNQGIICIGQGAWEEVSTTRILDTLFREKGIDVWVDYWGYDVNHDWPWWYKQAAYFIPKLLEN